MTEYRRAGNNRVKQLYSVQKAMDLIPWITNKQTNNPQTTPSSKTNRKEGTFTTRWKHFVWEQQEKSSTNQSRLHWSYLEDVTVCP